MRRALTIGIGLTLLFTCIPTSSVASNLAPGSKCPKVGKIQIFMGSKFICTKNGKKLVWRKAVNPANKVQSSPSDSSSSAPTPSASQAPATNPAPVPKARPTIQLSTKSDFRNTFECKLQNLGRNQDVNLSHSARNWRLLDPDKTIRILIFPVDFPDLVSPSNESPDFADLSSKIEDFYKSQSGNRLQFKWTVAPTFTRMSKSIESYGVGSRAAGSVWQLNNDIQDLAFTKYSRSDFDFIIGSAPTTTTREQIASSPAFGSNDNRYLGATYLGGDYWSGGRSWTIPAHEFGHFALGISDLYDFDSSMLGESGFERQFQFTGVYDIMNWAGGAGLELTAWNRWISKLISDSQMLCQPNSTTTTLLKPIESVNQEVKGLVIPISQSTVMVIENRAAQGFDSKLPVGAQGVIVYTVNTGIDTGRGPMQMVRKMGSSDIWFRDNALKVGESLTHLGYSIKVIAEFENDYYIEVSKAS